MCFARLVVFGSTSMRAFFPKSALALLFMLFMTSNFERRGWIYNKEKWFKTLGS